MGKDQRTKTNRPLSFYLSIVFVCLVSANLGSRLHLKSLIANEDPQPGKKAPIYLVTSVIWEGRNLRSYNIEALRKLREEFSDIKMTHFISPAYFTKPGANPFKVKAKLNSVIKPQDQVGLHIAPWKSLVDLSGMAYRDGPRFWGIDMPATKCVDDCGVDVPLLSYRGEELYRLVRMSRKILDMNGISDLKSFIASGWLSSPELRHAALAQGFEFDFSPIDAKLVELRLRNFPIYNWLQKTWPNIGAFNQPTKLGVGEKEMTLIGHSAPPIDYLDRVEMRSIFMRYLDRHRVNPSDPLTFHISLYQETAHKHASHMQTVLNDILTLSREAKVELIPLTLPLSQGTVARLSTK